jgi:two-component system, LytTR family, response regulator
MTNANMRVLIVDDEPVARQRLRRLLSEIDGVQLIGECKNGREAVAKITEDRPDLVLLDVQMPMMDGFAVLRSLPEDAMPIVVFVTAFDEHATAAFDVHALDYVVKPVEAERFRVAVERARRQLSMESTVERHQRLIDLLREQSGDAPTPAESSQVAARRPQRLLINEDGRRFFVSVADIDWIEAYGNYVRLHVGAKTHLLRATMAHVESSLDPSQFGRIHRSSIVNLLAVREIQPWFSGEHIVILKDGTKLKLSRNYRDRFQEQGML